VWTPWVAGHLTRVTESTPLRALALVCTLSPSPAESSSELMARQVLEQLAKHGVTGDAVRVVDHDVKPGVEVDLGDGDAWPAIRAQMMAADILIVSTPTWVGHMSSVAQRVLERLDGELSETDDSGRPLISGKVAVTAVVGNEDGAHKITADLMQPRLQKPRRDPRRGRLHHGDPGGERCRARPGAQGDALPEQLSGVRPRAPRGPRRVRARAWPGDGEASAGRWRPAPAR
jgi:NAD(P)H-dependent FMN reductase